MTITYLEIDTSSLNSDVSEMEEQIIKARKSMEALMADISELNTMWKGKANLAFREQAESDSKAMAELLKAVETLKDSMSKASKEYIKCENQVIEAVRAISI